MNSEITLNYPEWVRTLYPATNVIELASRLTGERFTAVDSRERQELAVQLVKKLSHQVSLNDQNPVTTQQIEWMHRTLQGAWAKHFGKNIWYFELAQDATVFRLTWG